MDRDQELAQLRARVAQLESLVERLTGDRTGVRREATPTAARTSGAPGVDRRRMLRNGLGLSAAAVAGMGMVDAAGSSAAAASGDPVVVGQSVAPSQVSDPPTRIHNNSGTTHPSVLLQVDNTTDVQPSLPDNTVAAIFATADGHDQDPRNLAGILAVSGFGTGVDGRSDVYQGVAGTSSFGTGVVGTSGTGTGVSATSEDGPGLTATSTDGRGIVASSSSGEAIHATSGTNIGVVGNGAFGVVGNGTTSDGSSGGVGVGASGATGVLSHGDDIGVDAASQTGVAVKATSTDGPGLSATSRGSAGVEASGATGVVASGGDAGVEASGATGVVANGDGIGVDASGLTGVLAHGDTIGVSASSATGVAVRATSQQQVAVEAVTDAVAAAVSAHNSAAGPGVRAVSASGIGAIFQGGRAAIRLVPHPTKGHPTSGDHQRGELVVDRTGAVWVCTKSGGPGTWKKLAFA